MRWLEAAERAFGDSGFAQLVTFGLSIASLIVAVLAWISSHRTSSRMVKIETGRDRLASLQASKAQLVADMRHINEHTCECELVITNLGLGQARNIRMTLDGRTLGTVKK